MIPPAVLPNKGTPTVEEAVKCVRQRSDETVASCEIQSAIDKKLSRSVPSHSNLDKSVLPILEVEISH